MEVQADSCVVQRAELGPARRGGLQADVPQLTDFDLPSSGQGCPGVGGELLDSGQRQAVTRWTFVVGRGCGGGSSFSSWWAARFPHHVCGLVNSQQAAQAAPGLSPSAGKSRREMPCWAAGPHARWRCTCSCLACRPQ